MARKKKIGNAHSSASQSKSRPGGRTRSTVDSGIELDAHPSITTNQFDKMPEALRDDVRRFHSSGIYWSQAYGCWRFQFWSDSTKDFRQDEEASFFIERRVDADNISVLFPPLKDFSNFELLISRIKDVIRESETKGYCFAVWNGKRFDFRN
jgi:hypothetical protein